MTTVARTEKGRCLMIEIPLPEPKLPECWSRRDRAILREKQRACRKVSKRLSRVMRKIALKRGRQKAAERRARERSEPEAVTVCRFDETPLGYLLKHECPLEWSMLSSIALTKKRVNADLILQGVMTSGNPIFNSDRFVAAIKDFKQNGLRTPNRQEDNLERDLSCIEELLYNEEEPGLTV